MFSVNTQRALFNQVVVGSLLILPTTTDYTRLPRLQRKKKRRENVLIQGSWSFHSDTKRKVGWCYSRSIVFRQDEKKKFLFRCDETTKRTVLFFRRNFTPVVCDWFKLVWLVGSGGRRGSKNVLSSAESSLSSSSFPLSFLETLPFLIFLSTPSLKTAFYSGRGYLFADEAILIAQRLH